MEFTVTRLIVPEPSFQGSRWELWPLFFILKTYSGPLGLGRVEVTQCREPERVMVIVLALAGQNLQNATPARYGLRSGGL